jgi:hypothetical protein
MRIAFASITIFGSGRLGPTATALLGLAGVVLGGLALVRARRGRAVGTRLDRQGPTAALVLGALALAFGVLFLATADAGPGTGNGVVGSGAAIVLGPIAMVLGGLARARRGTRIAA